MLNVTADLTTGLSTTDLDLPSLQGGRYLALPGIRVMLTRKTVWCQMAYRLR